jgi:hypothetical protein
MSIRYSPHCIQNSIAGAFLSHAHALGLTVPHKTVAELH